MGKLTLSKDQSKSRKEEVSSALAVHKTKKQGIKKPPKRQTSKSTAHATTAEGNTSGTRTPQQETAILRALGLTEGPTYPVTGEVYRLDFLEFRQHVFNKLPLYDGRAVTTLGSFRKPRNYKLVCALHPTCPFLLHGKNKLYADGLEYQEIKEVVTHTCSVQSHVNHSLCSSIFLKYFLREEEQQFPANGSRLQGVDGCAEAGRRFGIDLTSLARRQLFYKATRARNEQDGASALLAFRSPSPIFVSPKPMYNIESGARTISDHLLSIECHVASTTAELPASASAESTSHVASAVFPLVPSTQAVENPQPRQSERKTQV
jgi:hypothetical protein